jgi:hypothetical protein
MDIELVTAAADAVAAIAVVVSLVYLGRQIHISNLQSQAAARYSFLDAYGAGNATIANSTEASSVFYRGLSGGELSDAEKVQFTVLVGTFLNIWSVMYDLHQEGQLPESQWVIVKTDIHAMFDEGGGRQFWQDIGQNNVSPEFAAFVSGMLSSDNKAYSFIREN